MQSSKKTGQYISCCICGTKRYYKPSQLKHKRNRVCSQKCWIIFMKGKLTGKKRNSSQKENIRKSLQTGKYVACDICNKLKYYPIHRIKRNKHFFCSAECYHKGIRKYYIAEKSNNWKNGRTSLYNRIRNCEKNIDWKLNVLIRDNYTCQNCNKKGGYLEVHHLKPFRVILQEFLKHYKGLSPKKDMLILLKLSYTWKDFWDVNFGITYCKHCHNVIDKYRGV